MDMTNTDYVKELTLKIQNDTWDSFPNRLKIYVQGQYRLALKRLYEQDMIDKEYSIESATISGEVKTFENLFGKHNLEREVFMDD